MDANSRNGQAVDIDYYVAAGGDFGSIINLNGLFINDRTPQYVRHGQIPAQKPNPARLTENKNVLGEIYAPKIMMLSGSP